MMSTERGGYRYSGNYDDERVKDYCGADYNGDRADVAVDVAKEVFS